MLFTVMLEYASPPVQLTIFGQTGEVSVHFYWNINDSALISTSSEAAFV